MFQLFKKKEVDGTLYAPVSGKCIPLSQVQDQVFASKAMGDGVAFLYEGDTIYAPCDGKVIMVANTKHAIGIQADNGAEILLHIGMDTVNLQGQGFHVKKQVKDKIKRGDALIQFDRTFMEEHGINLTTPMVITNENDIQFSIKTESGIVTQGETAIMVCVK